MKRAPSSHVPGLELDETQLAAVSGGSQFESLKAMSPRVLNDDYCGITPWGPLIADPVPMPEPAKPKGYW